VIVLVDACHSGGLFKQKDGWPFAEMTMQAYTEAKTKQYQARDLAVPKELGNNIAFMTACDYSQTCWAGDPYSLYIGTVITGCLDSAVDVNGDGLYQFSELHAHAAQLASQENPDQTAQMFHEAVLTSVVARSVSSVVVPTIPITVGDFDGDGKNDPAIYHESAGRWILALSGSGYALTDLGAAWLGGSGYQAMTADYDGDGKADPAVYQASTGTWLIKLSASGYGLATVSDFGGSGYTPLVADFDGDRKADPAIYLPAVPSAQPMQAGQAAHGSWAVKLSGNNYLIAAMSNFGGAAYMPLAADYDGDRLADLAIYLPAVPSAQPMQAGQAATGTWQIKLSASGYGIAVVPDFGGSGYNTVAADFDGDGKADPAVQSPTDGYWQIKLSASGYSLATLSSFGGSGYGNAYAGDYDGDGKADPALYRSATATWYFRLSASAYSQGTLSSGYIP